MTFFHVVVLGIVQGLTEFIPVSSTAHLLVAQKILNIPATDATFSFSVLVQMGTVVSLFLFSGRICWASPLTPLKTSVACASSINCRKMQNLAGTLS